MHNHTTRQRRRDARGYRNRQRFWYRRPDGIVIELLADEGQQLSPSGARVSDPVLTTAARGYRNGEHIWHRLFPVVPVNERGGVRIEFDRTDFEIIDATRAPGAGTQEVQFGHAGKKYAVTQRRLIGKVPTELGEEAMRLAGINLAMRAINGVQDMISLQREKDAADRAFKAGNYDAAHKTATTAANKWTLATSNPTKQVMTGVEQIRKTIGRRPNMATMGGAAWSQLRTHPSILGQLQYQSKLIASKEDIARLWDLKEIVVGDAIYTTRGASEDIWGGHCLLAYTAVGSVSMYEPSYGYGYRLMGTPYVEMPYYDDNKKSWMYPVTEEWTNEIVGKDAAYLMSNVI